MRAHKGLRRACFSAWIRATAASSGTWPRAIRQLDRIQYALGGVVPTGRRPATGIRWPYVGSLTAVPRYRFSEFILSPRRRVLLRDGREQPLIPRYFDLLVFLIERRGDAVHRRDIFDRVWGDVIVSDSALSQAIRTIRRVLGDESREPRFIRTVPRHGYRFVFSEVIEEDDANDAAELVATPPAPSRETPPQLELDPYEPLLQR